jgi:hypothetical protein
VQSAEPPLEVVPDVPPLDVPDVPPLDVPDVPPLEVVPDVPPLLVPAAPLVLPFAVPLLLELELELEELGAGFESSVQLIATMAENVMVVAIVMGSFVDMATSPGISLLRCTLPWARTKASACARRNSLADKPASEQRDHHTEDELAPPVDHHSLCHAADSDQNEHDMDDALSGLEWLDRTHVLLRRRLLGQTAVWVVKHPASSMLEAVQRCSVFDALRHPNAPAPPDFRKALDPATLRAWHQRTTTEAVVGAALVVLGGSALLRR